MGLRGCLEWSGGPGRGSSKHPVGPPADDTGERMGGRGPEALVLVLLVPSDLPRSNLVTPTRHQRVGRRLESLASQAVSLGWPETSPRVQAAGLLFMVAAEQGLALPGVSSQGGPDGVFVVPVAISQTLRSRVHVWDARTPRWMGQEGMERGGLY